MTKQGKYKHPHFAIRIPKDLLNKLKYIAGYNGRSANKEIEQLIRVHVDDFESNHSIPAPDKAD